ncbi:type II toxin-antitoxin system RelE/ParE family toxin [Achromobacter sp. GG226]|uniref:type II toxin-antitoxin system RelE/ParE family toxin n=1 Tax=Verticiella alkaliphila TaxID=2779529 RepID=UPI001C0B7C7B|nr:type II toxin-antitoxin system RelE/ParE family toxin [Verticiella sp. GG226]MBU4610841.1 type II toxin-antitoxin system RelE/ParE family toxin [Verticiella sp. GG226]
MLRTLLATRLADTWFFLIGFAKNDRANITNAELQALRALADELLPLSPAQLALAAHAGTLLEICHDLATQQHPG